jgi:hypothetical protein
VTLALGILLHCSETPLGDKADGRSGACACAATAAHGRKRQFVNEYQVAHGAFTNVQSDRHPLSCKLHQRAFDQQAGRYLALPFRATISLASTRSKTWGLRSESKERLKLKASGSGPWACSRSSLAVDSMKVGT